MRRAGFSTIVTDFQPAGLGSKCIGNTHSFNRRLNIVHPNDVRAFQDRSSDRGQRSVKPFVRWRRRAIFISEDAAQKGFPRGSD
jgi:hypothetical protein